MKKKKILTWKPCLGFSGEHFNSALSLLLICGTKPSIHWIARRCDRAEQLRYSDRQRLRFFMPHAMKMVWLVLFPMQQLLFRCHDFVIPFSWISPGDGVVDLRTLIRQSELRRETPLRRRSDLWMILMRGFVEKHCLMLQEFLKSLPPVRCDRFIVILGFIFATFMVLTS